MTFLDDGKIVLVDRRNKSIKLFNDSLYLIHYICVGASVFDVTTIGHDEIAVSLPKKKLFVIFKQYRNSNQKGILTLSRIVTV